MFKVSLSVPSSPRTTRSCRRMDSSRTMTRSICGSYSGWATGEKMVNRCMRLSRHYSKSWGFRSNSSQMKRIYRAIQEASIPTMPNIPPMHKRGSITDHRNDPDELRSTLYTMRRLKAQERLDRDELQCQASISVNDPCWRFDRQQELQRERLKRQPLLHHLRNRRHCRLGGVG